MASMGSLSLVAFFNLFSDLRNYFVSTIPLQKLRVWHDWATAKRAYWLAMTGSPSRTEMKQILSMLLNTGLITIIIMMVEQEISFDSETLQYKVTLLPSIPHHRRS